MRSGAALAACALFVLCGCATHVDYAGVIRYNVDGREQLAIPEGRGRPLLVLLHGRGAKPDDFLRAGLHRDLTRLGRRAPNVVLPYGGDHSYWHDRRDARWGAYVLRDVIPVALRRTHADPSRVAIGGVSMGGFGALDLARIAPGRFCAVGGHSAALWQSPGDTAPGAFDDAADYARHDLFRLPFRYRGPLWLDGGSDDPFHDADVTFARAHGIRLHVWPGGHDWDYWSAHLADYLRFYVRSCR